MSKNTRSHSPRRQASALSRPHRARTRAQESALVHANHHNVVLEVGARIQPRAGHRFVRHSETDPAPSVDNAELLERVTWSVIRRGAPWNHAAQDLKDTVKARCWGYSECNAHTYLTSPGWFAAVPTRFHPFLAYVLAAHRRGAVGLQISQLDAAVILGVAVSTFRLWTKALERVGWIEVQRTFHAAPGVSAGKGYGTTIYRVGPGMAESGGGPISLLEGIPSVSKRERGAATGLSRRGRRAVHTMRGERRKHLWEQKHGPPTTSSADAAPPILSALLRVPIVGTLPRCTWGTKQNKPTPLRGEGFKSDGEDPASPGLFDSAPGGGWMDHSATPSPIDGWLGVDSTPPVAPVRAAVTTAEQIDPVVTPSVARGVQKKCKRDAGPDGPGAIAAWLRSHAHLLPLAFLFAVVACFVDAASPVMTSSSGDGGQLEGDGDSSGDGDGFFWAGEGSECLEHINCGPGLICDEQVCATAWGGQYTLTVGRFDIFCPDGDCWLLWRHYIDGVLMNPADDFTAMDGETLVVVRVEDLTPMGEFAEVESFSLSLLEAVEIWKTGQTISLVGTFDELNTCELQLEVK